MTEITDEFMRQMISRTRNYCVVILKAGPNRSKPGVEKIIWEHGRRNSLCERRDCCRLSARSPTEAKYQASESLVQISMQ